jgi:Ni/Fe-hydrogenase 1 B-type cytochrome subunit
MFNINNESGEVRYLIAKKVYDPFLRFLHWWNALSIFSLMLTIWLKDCLKPYQNWKEIIYHYHILIGYALTVGIFARIIWGIIGPKHAQFKNMFHLKDYIFILKNRKLDKSLHWGHDRYAGFLYLTLYLLMIYQAYSGLYLAAKHYNMGPFTSFISFSNDKDLIRNIIKKIHEIIFYFTMFFSFIHIFMLIFHEIKEKYPLAQSMFSGFQYRRKDESSKSDS